MIVVTGATGNVGRELVPALVAAGERVTAVSRGVAPVSLPPGVAHRAVALSDFPALAQVLDGADALFLLIAGDQHFDATDPGALLGLVKSAGIKQVVLLSSQAAGTRLDQVSHQRARELEAAVRDSGLDCTVLRPGGFHSNALAWAPSVRESGTIAAPFADVGLRLVDPADIAGVAARTLTEPGRHRGATYLLTGPEAVSPRQQAAAIGAALGRPVRFVELTREQALAGLEAVMPRAIAEGVLTLLGEPTPGELAPSPAVELVLGRPPRPFARWSSAHRAAFA
jgi:uncharacterized protein YbjT (DUF2867 family)